MTDVFTVQLPEGAQKSFLNANFVNYLGTYGDEEVSLFFSRDQ